MNKGAVKLNAEPGEKYMANVSLYFRMSQKPLHRTKKTCCATQLPTPVAAAQQRNNSKGTIHNDTRQRAKNDEGYQGAHSNQSPRQTQKPTDYIPHFYWQSLVLITVYVAS